MPGPKLDNCDDPGIDDLTCEDTKGDFTNKEFVNTREKIYLVLIAQSKKTYFTCLA